MQSAVRVQLQLRIVSDDDTVIRDEVILQLDKNADRLEAIGVGLEESKDLLGRVQHVVVAAQAAAYVDRHRGCPVCGRRLRSKGKYPIVFRTAFGNVPLASPRFHRCHCHRADSRSVSPLTELFTEHVAPELLFLETRWASLISYGMTVDLLKDVLPIAGTTNPETVRRHLHKVAARRESELAAEPLPRSGTCPPDDQDVAVAPVPLLVGIDGGYVRNWHDKQKKFEVVVGKSVPEERDGRYFGLVRSQDEAPRRRFCAVLRAQGLPSNPAITVLTDGGDSVRALTGELAPGAAHHLDWFHVAMRLTGLDQYAKGLGHHDPGEAAALQGRLARIKWRLWHGDADEALARAHKLAADVAALDSAYASLPRFAKAAAGLATYVQNNVAALPNLALYVVGRSVDEHIP